MAGEFHSRSYVGDADDIRIYNRDLNASEVLQLYNLEKPPANNSPPPTITSQPVADQNAMVGSNVTFSVDANGTGLTYHLKQDANGTWVNIGGATASATQSIQFKLSMPAPTAWPLLMPMVAPLQFEQCAECKRKRSFNPRLGCLLPLQRQCQ